MHMQLGMNTLPDKFGLNDGDNIVREPVDVEGRGEGDHHRHRHYRQDIHHLDNQILHVVVVYHVTIVAVGHGLLKKFWPLVIGCVLRTAGSSII